MNELEVSSENWIILNSFHTNVSYKCSYKMFLTIKISLDHKIDHKLIGS